MRKLFIGCLLLALTGRVDAQKQKFDSLAALLSAEKIDSNRVKLMWQMSDVSNMYAPGTSLQLAQEALYLAQKIKYTEGESRSLGVLAVAFREIGNYQKALGFFLQKLQIEEQRNSPRNLASVLINIGILYIYLEQYPEALAYYRRADSVITTRHVKDLEYYIYNNLGDVFERLNVNDSAYIFFNKSLAIAQAIRDEDLMGTSMVGLGHIYLKQEQFPLAAQYYKGALTYLESADDEDLICEASLGLARMYDRMEVADSAESYALRSLQVAKKDRFESRQLEAAQFLSDHYQRQHDTGNAFTFLAMSAVLKDSINSKEKVRALQVISSNEELRQNEMAENKRRAEEERQQQLQMLLIGIFIPVLFLITLLLSRIRVHQRLIKFLGILSLLMLFEYLLLVLHPRVLALTNHTPVYEMLIFVAIASILVPGHHRVEHWLIEKLTTTKPSSGPAEAVEEDVPVEAETIIVVAPETTTPATTEEDHTTAE